MSGVARLCSWRQIGRRSSPVLHSACYPTSSLRFKARNVIDNELRYLSSNLMLASKTSFSTVYMEANLARFDRFPNATGSGFLLNQKRNYLYLPTTWVDLKERLRQLWIEAEARTIRVRLLRKDALLPSSASSVDDLYQKSLDQAEQKYRKRSNIYRRNKIRVKHAVRKRTRNYRHRMNVLRSKIDEQVKIPVALRKPQERFKIYRQLRRIERNRQWNQWMQRLPRHRQMLSRRTASTEMNGDAQGGSLTKPVNLGEVFRSTFSDSTMIFANARRSELKSFRSNINRRMGRYYKDASWRVAWRYRRFNDRRKELWGRMKQRAGVGNLEADSNVGVPSIMTTRSLTLTEYSQPDWFDEIGRPLTSLDVTGRFVNPWMSQSTNGILSVDSIVAWQIMRIKRNLRKDGLVKMLTPQLSWNKAEPDDTVASEPLPAMFKDGSKRNGLDDTVAAIQFTWIGHSTSWIQMNGFSMLTDPIFSLRASPYQAIPIGVQREVPPSHTIDELVHHAKTECNHRAMIPGGEPSIDLCCITHDHYDHLDKNSVWDLRDHVKIWVVPLGIQEWLEYQCQIPPERIVELEWWEQVRLRKLEGLDDIMVVSKRSALEDDQESSEAAADPARDMLITCCPSQHWASRTMMDRNKRLWCSFSIEASSNTSTSENTKMFLCGDTGYPKFPLFRQISDLLGPFDFSAIPIGAYEPEYVNKEAHVGPAEAIRIHKKLRSKQSVGIHWGTFELSEESFDDPPRLLETYVNAENEMLRKNEEVIKFTTVDFGHTYEVPHSN